MYVRIDTFVPSGRIPVAAKPRDTLLTAGDRPVQGNPAKASDAAKAGLQGTSGIITPPKITSHFKEKFNELWKMILDEKTEVKYAAGQDWESMKYFVKKAQTLFSPKDASSLFTKMIDNTISLEAFECLVRALGYVYKMTVSYLGIAASEEMFGSAKGFMIDESPVAARMADPALSSEDRLFFMKIYNEKIEHGKLTNWCACRILEKYSNRYDSFFSGSLLISQKSLGSFRFAALAMGINEKDLIDAEAKISAKYYKGKMPSSKEEALKIYEALSKRTIALRSKGGPEYSAALLQVTAFSSILLKMLGSEKNMALAILKSRAYIMAEIYYDVSTALATPEKSDDTRALNDLARRADFLVIVDCVVQELYRAKEEGRPQNIEFIRNLLSLFGPGLKEAFEYMLNCTVLDKNSGGYKTNRGKLLSWYSANILSLQQALKDGTIGPDSQDFKAGVMALKQFEDTAVSLKIFTSKELSDIKTKTSDKVFPPCIKQVSTEDLKTKTLLRLTDINMLPKEMLDILKRVQREPGTSYYDWLCKHRKNAASIYFCPKADRFSGVLGYVLPNEHSVIVIDYWNEATDSQMPAFYTAEVLMHELNHNIEKEKLTKESASDGSLLSRMALERYAYAESANFLKNLLSDKTLAGNVDLEYLIEIMDSSKSRSDSASLILGIDPAGNEEVKAGQVSMLSSEMLGTDPTYLPPPYFLEQLRSFAGSDFERKIVLSEISRLYQAQQQGQLITTDSINPKNRDLLVGALQVVFGQSATGFATPELLNAIETINLSMGREGTESKLIDLVVINKLINNRQINDRLSKPPFTILSPAQINILRVAMETLYGIPQDGFSLLFAKTMQDETAIKGFLDELAKTNPVFTKDISKSFLTKDERVQGQLAIRKTLLNIAIKSLTVNIDRIFDLAPLNVLTTDERNAFKMVMLIQKVAGNQESGRLIALAIRNIDDCKKFVGLLIKSDAIFKKDICKESLTLEDFEQAKTTLRIYLKS